MNVRCPHCQTVFRLPPETLELAGGLVRCGCCDALFDGRFERVPAYRQTDDAPPMTARDPATDGGTAPEPDQDQDQEPYRQEGAAEDDLGAILDDTFDEALDTVHADAVARIDADALLAAAEQDAPRAPERRPAPEEVLGLADELAPPPPRPAHPGRTLLLGFANVVLLGLLGAQLALGLREPLLASPAWRPWLESGCELLGCRLPALRDPERVDVIARDIRAHPRYPNGLLVDVTIVNRATYIQPFPVMQLTFTSLDEQWFAQRRFQPAEYLGPNRGTAERLPPDIPVQVVLELLDPGPEAVSYAFEFL